MAGGLEWDSPVEPEHETAQPARLRDAFQRDVAYCRKNPFDYLKLLESEDEVWRLEPDLTALASIPPWGHRDGPGRRRIRLRIPFFGPAAGIPEYPVTGSAHCCLGPFGQQRLGKERLAGHQASPRVVTVRIEPKRARVRLYGQAVAVLQRS